MDHSFMRCAVRPASRSLILLLLICPLFGTPSARADSWTRVRAGDFRGNITDVCVLKDGVHGWLATTAGTYRTDNGGATWDACVVPAGLGIWRLQFLNQAEGWGFSGGYSGAILRTHDGGRTWNTNFVLPGSWFDDIFFFDELHGWVSGENLVLRTTDGGVNWTVDHEPGWEPVCIQFVTPMRGWMAGFTNAIYETVDGGANWTRLFGPAGWYSGIAFSDTLHGCVVGNLATSLPGSANISFTTDGGAHWQSIATPTTWPSLSAVSLDPTGHGFAVGAEGTILVTSDAGQTWSAQANPVANRLLAVAVRETTAWAGGICGTLLRAPAPVRPGTGATSGPGWSQMTTTSNAIRDVAFGDSLHAIAVGDYGLVLHSADGGVSWSESWIPASDVAEYECVRTQGPNRAWACGINAPGIMRSKDGGGSWTPVTPPLAGHPNGLDFADSLNGWVVIQPSGNSQVCRSRDGGATWTEQPAGEAWYWSCVCALDSLHVWLGGRQAYSSLIGRTVDGGKHWAQVTAPGSGVVRGVTFRDPSDGMAVTDNGEVFVSRDSGLTWSVFLQADSTAWFDVVRPDMTPAQFAGARLQADGSTTGLVEGITTPGSPSVVDLVAPGSWLLGLAFSPTAREVAVGYYGEVFSGAPLLDVPAGAERRLLALAPTFPNPARSRALVRFTLPAAEVVTLAIYDLQGRRVASLLDREPRSAGTHTVQVRTEGWPAGCYFCRLETGGARLTRKLVVLE